ncbi:class GN sortase [Gilvimarinus sp. SDUM040013]|uniref:Class GN sortase n=1 Tax=Gilvimarinus gilvus TaxID=3058038 RepID=A0ABU4RZ61_9GAMM|nr:class GN sortase [Gilvimarinus sp. SDUM040013]MDO3386796.1 class GN sortase [Gilvimarinus sp. SDUM040013]MDX6848274.1 class GN sortase [Gilvimarinus sp. SDUM040013]
MPKKNSDRQPLPLRHSGRLMLSAVLLLVLLYQWGSALGIEVKAQLAQVLIERAWQQKLDAPGVTARPWPWADTEPVGRLQWLDKEGRVERDLFVLSGTHGEALAFGPGLMDGSFADARVIGGHRDTHFAFLRDLRDGDRLRWQDENGHWRSYMISKRSIADARNNQLWIDPDADALWLVTCFPFDALRAGGPLRYVVRADSIDAYAERQELAGVRL